MNLRALANGLTSLVNPNVAATVTRTTGVVRTASYKSVPTAAPPEAAIVQLQAISGSDQRKIDGLNIQGIMTAMYVNTQLQGVNRPAGTGGDTVTIAAQPGLYVPRSGGASDTWKVEHVLEPWFTAGWCKVVAVLQVNP